FGQCAFSRHLTKKNQLLRVSHFDSHTPRPHRLLPLSVSRTAKHDLQPVVLVLATLFGLDAHDAALTIFILALLISLRECCSRGPVNRAGQGAPRVNAPREMSPSLVKNFRKSPLPPLSKNR